MDVMMVDHIPCMDEIPMNIDALDSWTGNDLNFLDDPIAQIGPANTKPELATELFVSGNLNIMWGSDDPSSALLNFLEMTPPPSPRQRTIMKPANISLPTDVTAYKLTNTKRKMPSNPVPVTKSTPKYTPYQPVRREKTTAAEPKKTPVPVESSSRNLVGVSESDQPESPSKRSSHNVLERKRRHDLKNSYQTLRNELPGLQNERTPAGTILTKAHQFIKELQKEQKKLISGIKVEQERRARLIAQQQQR
eukprot:m.41632 g.41632  ORF g.41632 m.41632 type:complete len:250 (+) comp9790_c0_seq2:106-855(+)